MVTDGTPVTQLMTAGVLTVTSDTPISDAADTLLEAGVSSLVVVDADHHPIGMLTSTDLAKIVSDGDFGDEVTVERYMTHEVVTIPEHASVRDAAAKMIVHGIHHLPVTGEDGVVGIVSTMDVTAFVSYREGSIMD
jgi:CBS domain-containing protein